MCVPPQDEVVVGCGDAVHHQIQTQAKAMGEQSYACKIA